MVQLAGGKLSIKHHFNCDKTIDGIYWKMSEPFRGFSLQRHRQHLAPNGIVKREQHHLRYKYTKMFV